MSALQIRSGTTLKLDRVDGELRAGKNVRIEALDPSTRLVTVNGGAQFGGDAELNCDFVCDSLELKGGKLKVNGNLTVLKRLDVGYWVDVQGTLRAQDVDVGWKITSNDMVCDRIRVGGLVEVNEMLEAGSVDVGGKVIVHGTIRLKDLGVGGKVDIGRGGGTISGHTKVDGQFTCEGRLEFGELEVYGKCFLPANCKGRKISTFGKLFINGDTTCEEVDVTGVTDVQGSCDAGKVLVNGKFGVTGSLNVSDMLEVHGLNEVRGDVKSSNLRVGGKLRATKVTVTGEVDVAGLMETVHGLKGKLVMVRSGSRCAGVLVGERVEIGKSRMTILNWGTNWIEQATAFRLIGSMTRVQDVYATEVEMGANSRAQKIFAEKVKLEDGCIADQVTYSHELRSSDHVFLTHPPEKVRRLPEPPL